MNPTNLTGQKIGPYEIREIMAHGSSSTIYRAYQPNMDRVVALKIVGQVAPEAMARTDKEVRVLAGLQHPHIVPIFDYGVYEGSLYWVMPMLEGRSVLERLKADGPLPPAEVSRIVSEIAAALDYAHQKGVVHRSLRPINILLGETGNAYLNAFAVDLNTDRAITGSGFQFESPHYMSPEQGMGLPLDGRTDVYALAVTTFEMLTGQPPYTADQPLTIIMKHMNDPIPSVVAANPHLPPALDAVMEKGMAKQRENRYGTAGEFAKALSTALEPAAFVPSVQIGSVAIAKTAKAQPSPPPVLKTRRARRVFISYSTRNRKLVEQLQDDLGSLGHTVWFDRELQSRGGQSWWDAILEQIRQAELFIFALTPESLASEPCSREYGYAAALNKPILPVRLVPMKTDILPPALLQIQWVDYLDKSTALPLLHDSIEHLAEPSALPATLPQPPDAPIPPINELWQRGTRAEELVPREQLSLLFELEALLMEGESLDTARELLREMQKRRDLTVQASQKISTLEAQFFNDNKRGRWPFGRR